MALTLIPINAPVFKLADSEAALTTGVAYECQLTSCEIASTPNMKDVPATGCAGASQTPGLSSWALNLNWLQDWTAPGGGLSGYAYTNETAEKWFSLQLDANVATTVATGHCWVISGSYGGAIGGDPAPATAVWPCLEKPDITFPAPVGLESEAA
jgi:hypothetical protein